MKCRKCGEVTNKDIIVIRSELHNGMYCKQCNSWIKWISKKELNNIKLIGEIEVK